MTSALPDYDGLSHVQLVEKADALQLVKTAAWGGDDPSPDNPEMFDAAVAEMERVNVAARKLTPQHIVGSGGIPVAEA